MLLNSVLLFVCLISLKLLCSVVVSSGWRSLVESFEKHQIYCNCAAETRNRSTSRRDVCRVVDLSLSLEGEVPSWLAFANWSMLFQDEYTVDTRGAVRGWRYGYPLRVLVQCFCVHPERSKVLQDVGVLVLGKTPVNDWFGRKSFRAMDFRRIFASIIWVFSALLVNEANVEV